MVKVMLRSGMLMSASLAFALNVSPMVNKIRRIKDRMLLVFMLVAAIWLS